MPYVNYNKYTNWTKESILEMLATDDVWVERALVAIYQRQTEWEKRTDTTHVENEVGFQVADAKWFAKFARQIMVKAEQGVPEGQRLSQRQLNYTRRPWHRGRRPIPTVAKYRGQILDIIEAKAKASGAKPLALQGR